MGYRRFGVPPGGAFDQESYLLGCALAGCEAGSLAIELSNAAVEIAFMAATRLSVLGAETIIEVDPDPGPQAADIRSIPPNSAFDVSRGASLRIAAPRQGLRVYLCVAGGWIPDGIDSPLARSGSRLSAGEALDHTEASPSGTIQRLADPPSSLRDGPIRVLPIPNSKLQTPNSELTISHSSDRTGIRLDGLEPVAIEEHPSEPACPGAIQITPSGQLIVIGPDGPTIGGYPKVGVVCSADLDRLAHLRPGQEVKFAEIDLETARRLDAEREARLRGLIGQVLISHAL